MQHQSALRDTSGCGSPLSNRQRLPNLVIDRLFGEQAAVMMKSLLDWTVTELVKYSATKHRHTFLGTHRDWWEMCAYYSETSVCANQKQRVMRAPPTSRSRSRWLCCWEYVHEATTQWNNTTRKIDGIVCISMLAHANAVSPMLHAPSVFFMCQS